jgi:formiminotetrahydrofolate cyclodeaminase
MENKLPAAEEFLIKENLPTDILSGDDINYAMIEFAKLHVEAALNEVTEKLYFRDSDGHVIRSEESNKLVLKVYPLTNIK